MHKLSKKEQKAIRKEIANEITARYESFCDVDEFKSEELFNSIMDLFEKRNESINVLLATLKVLIFSIYTIDILDEMGLEID